MGEEMLQKISKKYDAMNNGKSGDNALEKDIIEEKPPPDTWVRRGEYLVRRHTTPRT